AEPQFVLASATIANPGELAHALLGVDVTVIGDDAAPRAERTIALWNPELIDEELGQRASALGDAARLYATLVSRGLRTICFAKSRRGAELIHRLAADRVDGATAKRLAPYRAGYTPEPRRLIERRLVEGELLGDAALERAKHLPELKKTPAGFVWAGKDYPAARLSLRSSTPDSIAIVEEETGTLLGLVELERAYSTVHDGAVYLHLGEPYLVS